VHSRNVLLLWQHVCILASCRRVLRVGSLLWAASAAPTIGKRCIKDYRNTDKLYDGPVSACKIIIDIRTDVSSDTPHCPGESQR
jgi:hypothetical protein